MVKLVALYKKPADVSAFETHYKEIHTPLTKKMPGLKKLEVPGRKPKILDSSVS